MASYVLRSKREIGKMRRAGLVVWEAHQSAARMIAAGVTTAAINQVYIDVFAKHEAKPLFLNYGGSEHRPPFPAEICASVNEQVVHGIPSDRELIAGDVISVDTGCKVSGWCGDAAVTIPIGEIEPNTQKLLDVTQGTLDLAIDLMSKSKWWSEVAKEMQSYAEGEGFSVVKEMVGHGIGKNLHEAPQVPNYPSQELTGGQDFELQAGHVIAVEPMINAGVADIEELEDGWTINTVDGQPSAHFEHTLAVTADGVVRLTGPPNDEELASMPEWLHDKDGWLRW